MRCRGKGGKVRREYVLFVTDLILIGLVGLPVMSFAQEGKWIKKADMLTARDSSATCVVDGKIYAIGGWPPDAGLKTVEEYDPVTDKWTRKADMPTARHVLSTSVVDGKIYAIGGTNTGVSGLSTVEVYNPATDKWAKCSNMPTPRWALSTCAVNGKIYAIGGGDRPGPSFSTVEEYDPATDKWTKKADMPTARDGLSASVVNDEIYVIGGKSALALVWNPLSAVEVYNPAKDNWTKKADMPTARCYLASGVNGIMKM